MYIRRKVFSVLENELGEEKLFSTTELDYGFADSEEDQKMFADLGDMTPDSVKSEIGKSLGLKSILDSIKGYVGEAGEYIGEHKTGAATAAVGATALAAATAAIRKMIKNKKAKETLAGKIKGIVGKSGELSKDALDAIRKLAKQGEKQVGSGVKETKKLGSNILDYVKENPLKTGLGVAGTTAAAGLTAYGINKAKESRRAEDEALARMVDKDIK